MGLTAMVSGECGSGTRYFVIPIQNNTRWSCCGRGKYKGIALRVIGEIVDGIVTGRNKVDLGIRASTEPGMVCLWLDSLSKAIIK